MSYAAKYLQAHGQACTILRDVPVQSYASLKRSTRATRDPGARDAYWEGLILAESLLASGEVIQIGGTLYLVQSVDSDPASSELAFFAAKVNASLTLSRRVESVDENGNIIVVWQQIAANIPGFIQVVTAALRQQDPGLLSNTVYMAQVAKANNVQILDRLTFNSKNYQVDAIDEVGLPGVVRVQLSSDERP